MTTFAAACGIIGAVISVVGTMIESTLENPSLIGFYIFWQAPAELLTPFLLLDEPSVRVRNAVEIVLNTGLSAAAGALLGLVIHVFSFGGNMMRIRKASAMLSVPVLLMSILWFFICCWPPLGASTSLYPYWRTLYYLSWLSAGLAVILFARARQSRPAVFCLAINGIGAALNLIAPYVLRSMIVPYIRF